MISDFDLDIAQTQLHKLDPQQKERVLALLEERDRLKRLEDAREHFLPFVSAVWPAFKAGAHHKLMAEAFERVAAGECKRLIINMAPRHRLALTTPIATTNGWKTMATVQPGDYVFSPSGAPVLVTGKSGVYVEDIYEVTTTDGQVIECDGTHLWSVRFGGNDRAFETLPTNEIMRKTYEESWAKHNNRPKLPLVAPVEYEEKNLLVPPYVLGAWLGDGAASCGTMAAHPDDAPYIRSRFEASGIETNDLSTPYIFGTKTLRIKFREIGVLHDKHIPEEYLTASPAQRLALMQGLMDTDGMVAPSGKCTFHNSNKRLIDGFVELVHSFGLKAQFTTRQTHYKGVPSKPSYRVSFRMAYAASLPRKARYCRGIQGNFARSIDIVKTDRRAEVQCLEVENEDGLFLAGRGYVPTHNTKSEFASWLLPAWFIGKNPGKKIIQASATEDLASGFGRKVRNLVGAEYDEDDDNPNGVPYNEIFPKVKLSKDSKAAAGWATNYGGVYFAIGVNGRVTGKGGDIVIIDDVHTEQEAKQAATNPAIYDAAYEWYKTGPRQRLQPGAAIIIVMTRWSKRDLTGRLLDEMAKLEPGEDGDRWEVLNLPAILDEGEPTERPMWPGFWPLAELRATKKSIGPVLFGAQYQQNPTSEESAILKRDYWRRWGSATEVCPGPHNRAAWDNLDPPACDYIIASWDTAIKKTQRADYSAMSLWGVFKAEDPETGKTINNIIMLSAFKGRLEFPELKRKIKQFQEEDMPDTVLIEDKGSGSSLIQELRSMGFPVEAYSYGRGSKGAPNDKVARANVISDIFASGYVWAPERKFADDVIDECAAFPSGAHDDYVDSTVQAMLRFRAGGFIRTSLDEEEDDAPSRYTRARMY